VSVQVMGSAVNLEPLRRHLYNRAPLIGGWLRRGAVAALVRDGSVEAVDLLVEAVVRGGDEGARQIPFDALRDLAAQGHRAAREALCRLT